MSTIPESDEAGSTEARLIDAWNAKNDPNSPGRSKHEQMLSTLGNLVCQFEAIVDGYFQPPNILACRGKEWDVFIRRKGSSEEFGPSDWQTGESNG